MRESVYLLLIVAFETQAFREVEFNVTFLEFKFLLNFVCVSRCVLLLIDAFETLKLLGRWSLMPLSLGSDSF